MEELRATSQYQFAVHPLGIPSPAAQEIVNTFLVVAKLMVTVSVATRVWAALLTPSCRLKRLIIGQSPNLPEDDHFLEKQVQKLWTLIQWK